MNRIRERPRRCADHCVSGAVQAIPSFEMPHVLSLLLCRTAPTKLLNEVPPSVGLGSIRFDIAMSALSSAIHNTARHYVQLRPVCLSPSCVQSANNGYSRDSSCVLASVDLARRDVNSYYALENRDASPRAQNRRVSAVAACTQVARPKRFELMTQIRSPMLDIQTVAGRGDNVGPTASVGECRRATRMSSLCPLACTPIYWTSVGHGC